MSPRAMRRYAPSQLVCSECGQSIRYGQFGGWDHARRLKIMDPQWHPAKP